MALIAMAASSQEYPIKPIRLIVAYPPGGGGDSIGRTLATPLSRELGQPVIVDNKPGAAGSLGAQALSMAPADGYTLMVADRGILVFNMGLFRKLPYDPMRDFAPVGTAVTSHFVLVGPAANAHTDLAALLARAKAAPGKLNYAITATGSTAAMELLKQRAGIDVVGVPYRGAAPALTAVLAGEVDLALLDLATALPYVRAGKLKAYAVTAAKRLPWLPDTPPVSEAGKLPGFEAMTWVSVVAPRGTPPAIVERLNRALNVALKSPETIAKFESLAMEITPGTPAQLQERWREEQAVWPERLRTWGISAE